MAGRPRSKAIAVLASVGAIGIVALGARASTRTFDGAQWGRLLESRLRESSAALRARIATLAEMPILAAAVSTDPTTVRDLTQDELAFRPRAGETIVIAQVPMNGTPVVLLVLPSGADAPLTDPSRGPLIRIGGGALHISEAIRVIPRERAKEVQGVLAASQIVDIRDFSERLTDEKIGASIVVGGQSLNVSGPEHPAGAAPRQFEVRVDSPASVNIYLILSVPVEPPLTPYWIGAAGMALVALFFGTRGRPDVAPIVLPQPTPAIWAPPAIPKDASSAAPSALPPTVFIGATGAKIGRYEIVQHIGTGGMADVYLAQTTGEAGITKRIALKVLERSFARQPELVEHFLDEARVASMLDHPNIVQIIDVGRAGADYFIAMEHIDGSDLARLIEISASRKTQIPLPIVLAILRKVCDGLYAAHMAHAPDGTPLGVVHRDVKCGNVLVARNGVVKIGDFGIAMSNHPSRVTRTQIGLVKGTPGYMAPEHRLGQAIDGRTDLYGVGAIAYEMLAGILINLEFSVLAQSGRDGWPHLPPLSRFRNDVPPDLEAAIFRALSYDAADRFADCAVLELTLEAIATRYPPVGNDKTIARWIDSMLSVEGPAITQAQAEPRPWGLDG